jgi:Ca2+-binding EF-hand superfamily protein
MNVLVREIQVVIKLFFSHSMQLNLIGHCHGLSEEEIKELWVQADIDGNGVLDYKEFLVNYFT